MFRSDAVWGQGIYPEIFQIEGDDDISMSMNGNGENMSVTGMVCQSVDRGFVSRDKSIDAAQKRLKSLIQASCLCRTDAPGFHEVAYHFLPDLLAHV